MPLTQESPDGQTMPQPPQLLRSDDSLTQLPLQSVVGDGQAHPPLAQFVPPVHTMPQPPQSWLLLLVSTHDPLQSTRLPEHVITHIDMSQASLVGQTVVHEPQALGSFVVLVHTPLQTISLLGHWHVPPTHE